MPTDDLDQAIVTLDGPAGVGKSTVARRVARELGYRYLDSGSMYRAVTLACERQGLADDPLDEARIAVLLADLPLEVAEGGRVWLGEEEVTEELRTPEVTRRVSAIAALRVVREAMVLLQRAVAERIRGEGGGVVVEGRDIGSRVFPRARHRFYLDATPRERARRRLRQDDTGEPLEVWERRIEERDRKDRQRDLNPLVVPDGAVTLETTEMNEDEVVAAIVKAVRS